MKRIVIRTGRPEAFHGMATRLQKLFPECEVSISAFYHDANDPSQDDGLIDKHGFQNKGAGDGKNSNRR